MKNTAPRWLFFLFPAVAMLLGWGLRGYIGGGPYGALMPGCFVALSLALLLGYRVETAAIATLFGAIGIGYGGNMTYGQTLGFLRETDTVYWGLLGCLVKGTAWGLLGGAVMGIGFSRDHYARKTVCIGLVLSLVAYYVGVWLINEPKLIYFSDPVNKPRGESWAGMYAAALVLLLYLKTQGSRKAFQLPLHFALWGALGGGIGFAGGALWMVIGPLLPLPQAWIGWWKVMEFFFGFSLGGAFGYCAYLHRAALYQAGQEGDAPAPNGKGALGFVAYVVLLFFGFALLRNAISFTTIMGIAAQVLFGYVFFATVALSIGLYSRHAAWQAGITMAFFHTVLDYTRDLNTTNHFGYTAPGWVQLTIIVLLCALVGYLVHRFQGHEQPVVSLFLLAIWACYLSGCARSFLHYDYLFPPEGQGRIAYILAEKSALPFVHLTFTVAALWCTWAVYTYFRRPAEGASESPS